MNITQRCHSVAKAQGNLDDKKARENLVEAKIEEPIRNNAAHFGSELGTTIAPDPASIEEDEQVTEADGTSTGSSVQDVSPSAASVEPRGHAHQTRPDRQPSQTKTSRMGTGLLLEREMKAVHQDSIYPQVVRIPDHAKAKASTIPLRLSIPGPVRSHSHSRRQVGNQHCPYGQGRRESTRHVQTDASNGQLRASSQNDESSSRSRVLELPDLVAVKQATAISIESRKSFIPIRRQFKESEREDSEADVFPRKLPKHGSRKDENGDTEKAEDADIDTDHEAALVHHKNAGSGAVEHSGLEVAKLSKSNVLGSSVQVRDVCSGTKIQAELEPLATTSSSTALEEGESLYPGSPNDSDLISLRDFTATEPVNYRIKRLSHAAPERGPTLRISEDAEMILLGADSEEESAGRELGARKTSSTADLRKSTMIKEQLKASKDRILKGNLPLSRSTTSRSLSKFDTKLNPSTDGEPGPDDSGTIDANSARAGSDANSSQETQNIRDKDPFVGSGYLSLRRSVTEHHQLDNDTDWTLRCAGAPHLDLNTVSEHASEEEDSWIAPLAAGVAQNDDDVGTPVPKVPNNSPTTGNLEILQRASNRFTHVQNMLIDATESSDAAHSTTQIEASFPPRISSRTQFQEMVQEWSDEDQHSRSLHSAGPGIPNRFDSIQSLSQLKVISNAPTVVTRSETERRLDYNTSTNSPSSLQCLRTPHSTNSQLSTTKGVLSNFRGLFHKQSLETAAAGSITNDNPSSRRKNTVVGKIGSPLPFLGTPVPSKPLSRDQSRRNNRTITTLRELGGDRGIDSVLPAYDSPDQGEMQVAERLAVQVLDSAMLETNAQKKAELVQVSRISTSLSCCLETCH